MSNIELVKLSTVQDQAVLPEMFELMFMHGFKKTRFIC